MRRVFQALGGTALTVSLCVSCSSTGGEGEVASYESQALVVAVPARIQAESYVRFAETTAVNSGGQCDRGDGVDMELTSDPNGGNCDVGWTAAGEWLEYDISTPTARAYDISVRAASMLTPRSYHVNLDGVSLGTKTAPSAGWQSFQDQVFSQVNLSAGNHVLRLAFDTGEVNVNYLDVTASAVTATCTDGIKNGTETGIDCGGSCPACPVAACTEQALARSAATASSSENANFPASLAIDGNTTTRWASAFSDPQWIFVDLGTSRHISKVVLNWEAAASKAYEIGVSNSASGPWQVVFSTSTGTGGIETISGLNATGRFVRMNSTARTTAFGNSLFEFQVFGDANPSCTVACAVSTTNSTTLSLKRADIGAREIINGVGLGARIVVDPVGGKLHFLTADGGIFQLNVAAGSGSTKTQLITGTQIMAGSGMTAASFQGLAFAPNGAMYVMANVTAGASNRGIVRRGTGTGSRTWVTFALTDPYPDSNTPFDHHFNGVVVSPDGNFVYITSGSRTDHGEIQSAAGQFPNAREVPLTASMFRLPTSGVNLVLKNDTAALNSAGFLFATGLRNSFDPQFGPGGEIFAGDNGPDADYSEELNVVRVGKNYGFPWRLGSENNSQQFSTYNPVKDAAGNWSDPRLHTGFAAVDNGSYKNDPTYPPAPAGLVDPITNRGPDADQFRDVTTGQVVDASATGRPMSTFTAHRSPLGLTFDNAGALCGDFKNNAVILSWGTANPVFPDHGEDLVLLKLRTIGTGQGYDVEASQIVTGLVRPIDSVLIGSKLYILEYSETAAGRIYELSLPH